MLSHIKKYSAAALMAVAAVALFAYTSVYAQTITDTPTLNVSISPDTPPSQTFLPSTKNVTFATFSFAALNADIRIAKITFTFTGTALTNTSVSNIRLWDETGSTLTTPVSSPIDSNNQVIFYDLRGVISKDTVKKIRLVGDITENPGEGTVMFSINQQSHIIAYKGDTVENPITPSGTFPIKGNVMTIVSDPTTNKPPVITGVSGPTSLKVNETGTWTITANDPEGGALTYTIDWGDSTSFPTPISPPAILNSGQKATFTHSYAQAGTYTVSFTVTDDKGASAKSTITTAVTDELLPDLKPVKLEITNPSRTGNEIWKAGDRLSVAIGIKNIGSAQTPTKVSYTVNLGFVQLESETPTTLKPQEVYESLHTVTLQSDITKTFNATLTADQSYASTGWTPIKETDETNNALAIVLIIGKENTPPVITGVSGPTSLKVNEEGKWIINANDPEGGLFTVTADWQDGSTPEFPTGTSTIAFHHRYTSTGNYSITFTVTDDKGASAKSTVSVNVINIDASNVIVISPTWTDAWQIGYEYNILWTYPKELANKKVNVFVLALPYPSYESQGTIIFQKDGVTAPSPDLAGEVIGNTMWKIPASIKTGQYNVQVQVTAVDTGKFYDDLSDLFSIVQSPTINQPAITRITPTSGAPGTVLTIYGKNLQDDCGKREERVCQLTISLGGYEIKRDRFVEFKVTWAQDRITLVVPPKAQTGAVRIMRVDSEYKDKSYDIMGPVFTVANKIFPGIVCEVKIPENVIIIDSYVDVGQGNSAYWIKNGGTLKTGAGSNKFFIENGGKKFGGGGSHTAYVKKGGSFDGEGGGSNVIYYEEGANITNPGGSSEMKKCGQITFTSSSTITTPPTTTQIRDTARTLHADNIDALLAEIKLLRSQVREQETKIKYLEKLTSGAQEISQKTEEQLNTFIAYGVDENTKRLGTGERAAVLHSFKSAFNKLPESEDELNDAILIANGKWPKARSEEAEARAEKEFKRIYKREAVMDNQNDNAAITVMAYGLRQRAENRNLKSETQGIKTFKHIYGHVPQTTEEWNLMQGITYSGATAKQ
ncbi:MAG: hypothetical protein A3E05_03095 [Candidatus Jacksonbacteria bacterium RIFCSPHIGHO2_12_FULL_44_12]|nr:MAG: hypothetical protein A3E05_03095 [Candidatus Jacksonbacteria bacterium RIFCSPHIGHO2_12_FULL_44_12]